MPGPRPGIGLWGLSARAVAGSWSAPQRRSGRGRVPGQGLGTGPEDIDEKGHLEGFFA